jgi:lipopolysaccharide transport system ATP-binding protein
MIRDVIMNFAKRPFKNTNNRSVFWALKDISFAVQKGEVVGIIGRNGAGKSTLLKVLSKISYPTSGTLQVNGQISSLLEVGTGFHEELTGRENIYLNGSILGMNKKEIDGKFDAIVDFADVEKFIDTPIKRYSSGMRLRLGFAVSAHLDSEILLVDEVLAVGDAEFQKKCLNKMDHLSSGGRTILFVSHNMAAVENLCSRVIWIENGKLRIDGDTSEVIKKYLAQFTAKNTSGSDLSLIEKRSGTGEVRFTGIEFLDQRGNAERLHRVGEPLRARLFYKTIKSIDNPYFGFMIYSEHGTLIADVSTWATGYNISSLPVGDGYVDLLIESLNLMPGRYYVSLWCSNVSKGDYDFLEFCVALDLQESDLNRSGRGIGRRYGLVYLPCSWQSPNLLDISINQNTRNGLRVTSEK